MSEIVEVKGRRPLVEHHPALDLRPVLKAGINARVRVEWRPDHGYPLAEAIIQVALQSLAMDWGHFDGCYEHVRLPYDFERPEIGAPREVWFSCPRCGQRRRKLHLYLGVWKCRKCHGMGHEKQYTTRYDQIVEEKIALQAELKGGRRRYQRHDNFDAKLIQFAELERKIASMRPSHTHKGISTRRVSAVYSAE